MVATQLIVAENLLIAFSPSVSKLLRLSDGQCGEPDLDLREDGHWRQKFRLPNLINQYFFFSE